MLSLAALLGLRPEGGMTNCPAAMKSSSENTLSKNQLPSAANFGLNILAGYATPVTQNKIETFYKKTTTYVVRLLAYQCISELCTELSSRRPSPLRGSIQEELGG